MSIINGLAMPIGMVVFGPLGDLISIELLLIITGSLLVLGTPILYTRKELLEAGAPQSTSDTSS